MTTTKEKLNEAEAARALADVKVAEAKAAHHKQMARVSAAEAGIAEIQLASAREKHEMFANDDEHHHVVRFSATVDSATVSSVVSRLARWHRQDPTAPWTIVFDSPGGDVISGMHLFDDIVTFSKRGGGTHHVTTVARGFAASMAGILLQAGDERLIGAESFLLIHEISAGAIGKIGELEDRMKLYEKMCERVVNIFYERSGGKTAKSVFKKNWSRKDWWIDSTQALKLGYADRVG